MEFIELLRHRIGKENETLLRINQGLLEKAKEALRAGIQRRIDKKAAGE
ncbi:unnamed protein product [Chrysoparadoxa australica]